MNERVVPRRGEKWRVTIEGIVDCRCEDGCDIDGNWFGDSTGIWEKLEDAAPDWEPGEPMQDAAGNVWLRTAGDRWINNWRTVGHDFPVRPWTRLLPNRGAK